MAKIDKRKKLLSIGLAGIMTVSVMAGVTAKPITAVAADTESERVYAGTPHTPKSDAYKYNLKTGESDYSVILYPGEKLGWECENPDIGYGTQGNLSCNDAENLNPKWTQQGYTYRYGLQLDSQAEELLDEIEYAFKTETLDWTTGDGNESQEAGEKAFAFNDTINVKADAKGPVRLKYKSSPKAIESSLKCTEGTHILRTYRAYIGYIFEAEALGGSSFAVSYDLAGGIVPSGEKYPTDFYFSDTDYTYPAKEPVRFGYEFIGWDGVGGYLIYYQNKFSVNRLETNNYSWNDAKDLVENGVKLTAKWNYCDMKVTFDYNGGKYKETNGEVTDATEETTTISLTGYYKVDPDDKNNFWFTDYTERLYKDGYIFDGWYVGDTKINCFNDIPKSVWNSEQKYTLKAKWKAAPKHTHTFASTLSSDETSHWYSASCEHKTEIKDKAAHTFKEVIDKKATEQKAGSKREECSVCGYKKASVSIPKLAPTPKKNTTPVKADNGSKVTTTTKGEATLTEVKKTSAKSITVKSTVKLGGVNYKVVAINANAFKNASKAKTVTLPDIVSKIKANAFAKSKITTIKLTVKKGAKLSVAKKAFKNSKVKTVQVNISKKATTKDKKAIIKAFTDAGIKKANIKIKKVV